MPLEMGRVLQDRYRIEATISEHANGGVYRATDQSNNQPCIVKEFLGVAAGEFQAAADALRNRIHPTLPEVFDYFSLEDEQHYLVMEEVHGESLTARLDRLGPLTEGEAKNWIGQVLAALDYLHLREPPIIHGDVKPDNILITPDGEAVLVDYGIGRTLNPSTPATLVAPEQVAGQAEVRSDVYAAGATLYTALTNHIPGDMGGDLADRFAITPLRSLDETISPEMARVVEKAMAHKAEARFESIREMRKAFGRASVRAASEASEPVADATPAQRTRRPRFGWGFVAIALAVLAIVGLGGLARNGDVAQANPVVSPTSAAQAAGSLPRPSATASPAPTLTSTTEPTAAPTTAPTATARPATATLAPTLGVGSQQVSEVDGAALVYVPAGAFIMGSSFADPLAFDDEQPQHVVDLPAFWIDRTEVTNGQYIACVEAGGCTEPVFGNSALRLNYYGNPDYDSHPVVWVRWNQAEEYCRWAGRRLPTESEWEKAARGTDGGLYPWGDEEPTEDHANFDLLGRDTEPVGRFAAGASPYDALDMAGNVAEWIGSFYTTTYFSHYAHLTATPEAPFRFHGGLHGLRNGAWNDNAANIRAASRRFAPNGSYSSNNVGFRCAMTADS